MVLNPKPQSLEGRGGVRSSSHGQGAGELGEEAESPKAVSAGLALTQDVRTLAREKPGLQSQGVRGRKREQVKGLLEPREAVQTPGGPCP